MDKVAIMNEARKKYRLEHEAKVKEQARISFEQYKNNPLFIAGIMLYWAEGMRSEVRGSRYQLALSNCDYKLLKIYCDFIRNFFKDASEKMGARLFLDSDLDEEKANEFWAKKLEIPLQRFGKSTFLKSRTRITKNRLPYGTCSVFLNSRKMRIIMEAWIDCFVNTRV